MKTRYILWFLLFSSLTQLYAQEELKYQMPPQALAAVVDAPATPTVQLDPTGQFILFLTRSENPTIEDLSAEMLRLAGLRIDPRINASSRPSYSVDLELMVLNGQIRKKFTGMPDPMRIQQVSWAPDSRGFAFLQTGDNGMYLWYADLATMSAKQLMKSPVNGLLGSAITWLPASDALICKIVPENRGPRPVFSTVPAGPVVQQTAGNKAAVRTNQDMLTGYNDEVLFDYLGKSRVVVVSLDGSVRDLLKTDLYTRLDLSPDGRYLLSSRLTKPYSYLVGYSEFPTTMEIFNLQGEKVTDLLKRSLMENVSTGYDATSPGPRNIQWRDDLPASLYWVEALDGGDPKKQVEYRDQIYRLDPPFTGKAVPQLKTRLRFSGITWATSDLAVLRQGSSKTKQQIIAFFNPSNPGVEPQVVWDRSTEDKYGDPGSFVMSNTPGKSVILIANKGKTMFLTGNGASPQGDRPFLDKFDIVTRKTTRIWQSEAPYLESVSRILDPEKLIILLTRQSVEEPVNYFIRDLKSKKPSLVRVTDFKNPYPFMQGVKKERITYMRKDGVQLTATLYTPAGWKKEDGPLPTLMWAYPVEYKSKDAAGQVSGSPYAFTRMSPSSAVPFVTQGYAILDNAAFPIIGEGESEPNDTFIEQLIANARAAIDKAVEMGVTDPKRVAAGGHSYGAFMTANLLAHSDLFAAGIARSGAYNRSLTPFGFQSEPRTFWEATDLYNKMSPFNYADKVKTPILLIHGIADNNQGTFPIQSERFYAALKGHGATARLVLLPLESHGYAARESLLHMLWEMNTWMDTYVKNKK